jgi:hypothetical protein
VVIRTQISMTEQQAEGLRHLAALRRVSQAALMREALDHVVEADERARRLARARRALGSFPSGRSDTSATHDAVLDEAYVG